MIYGFIFHMCWPKERDAMLGHEMRWIWYFFVFTYVQKDTSTKLRIQI